MKNTVFLIALIINLAINYANCLTCISNVLGTTGTTGTSTCSSVGVQACYKVNTGFTSTAVTNGIAFGTTSALTQSFVANDRGCLPVLVSTAIAGAVAGTAQSTTLQMTVGSQGTPTANIVLNDYWALQSNLCGVYGTCCTSTNCNPATKTVFNPINLALTLVFSLISCLTIF